MSTKPKISAFCCTYGRPFCLEEAIYSFLIQDYEGEKELVILNDLEDQFLIFDHPQVKIINSNKRISPLNKKFNECISYCTGEYIFVWEDDDIYLPWKITFSINNLDKNGCFHTGNAFLERNIDDLALCGNLHHSSLCMHKDNWNKIGYYDYDSTDWCGLDATIFSKIRKNFGDISKQIKPEEVFYIYRWSHSGGYHSSARQNNVSDFAKENVDNYLASGKINRGNVLLNPRWSYDFLESRNKCLLSQK